MSAQEKERFAAHQRHLETAYARDLPITLTRYAAPELIGRRVIRYCDVLDYLYEQQKWTAEQQRAHQPSLSLPGSVLSAEQERAAAATTSRAGRSGYRNEAGALAVASVSDSAADTRPHAASQIDQGALLPHVLSIAVGKAPVCTSDVSVQSYRPKDWRALEAVGITPASLHAEAGIAEAAASTRPSRQTYTALVQHEDRQYAHNLAMGYLMRGMSPSTTASMDSTHGVESEGGEVDGAATVTRVSIEEAAKMAGIDLADLPTVLFQSPSLDNKLTVNQDLFYGMREVPNDRPAYIETLTQWSKTLSEVDAGTTALTPLVNETPAFMRHLLSSAVVKGGRGDVRDVATATQASPLARDAPAAAAHSAEVDAYAYHPLVKPKPEQVLDSLVPPRLLVFFDVEPGALAREYNRRMVCDQRIRELLIEYYRDSSDGTSNKMQQLLDDVRAQHAQKHAENAVVGTAFLLVERASRAQCPREDLLRLEQDLEAHLLETRARCWGAPIYMNPQSSNFLGTVQGNEALAETRAQREKRLEKGPVGGEARVLRPSPPPRGPATASRGTTTKAVPMANRPETSTQNKKATNVSTFFASTIHEGTVPAVQDPTTGGTATVMTTLNMLELNAERTTLLFYLLRDELLRQVTLDSAECGVLLSRLLAEADVALNAREVVLRESLSHSQESLDKDQGSREELSVDEAALEKDLVALRAKLHSAQTRKRSIESWIEERKTLEKTKATREKNFHDLLLERLQRHTDEVRAAQDRDRRGSVDATA